MRTALAAALLAPCICAFAEGEAEQMKGVKVVTAENEVVRLYSGSYALLVGNSDYAQWPRLHWPALDVDEIASVLGNLGFKTYVYKNLSVSGFRSAMAEFIQAHGKDSQAQLLVYYAGHGHTALGAGGRRLGYIAMTDTPDANRPDFLAKAVGLDDFQSYAYTVTARHVLFVFDSCFAGSVMRSYETPRSLNKYVTLPAREFLTAGDADEPVPDRSYFKTILVQVLQGVIQEPVPDGYLTGEEIGVLMKSVIPSISRSQHPQYSKIGDPALNKGDFVFVLKKGASPPLRPAVAAYEKPRYQNEGTLWLAKDLYTRGAHARAIEEFRKAAGLDSAEAMTFLGYMLFRGQGVPADSEAARRWFEKAARLGNTSAMNNLGFMYGPGGVPPLDVAKARSWLSQAAERGDVCAAYNLGMLYLRDGASAPDRGRGLELLRRAAEAGYGEAMNNLAYHLAAARDGAGAVRWYEEAASSGETSALFNLGFLYYEGKVVARDYSKAHQLFSRGAQTGHPGAMNSLGWMCMNGHGVGRDYAAAARWFEQASRAGNAAAANNLGALWESGKLGKKDLRTALEWYRTSANEGNPGGLVNLARFYDEGLVVPSNRREAIRLYGEAARLGESHAAERLRQIQGQP
jgi:TPR repeat protein